jgi:methionyl-tRNA formyltransferase
VTITEDDSTGTLTERLAARGAELLVQTLEALDRAGVTPIPQPAEGVTTAAKVEPAEAELDFSKEAVELARAVRAFDPAPGAYTWIGRTRVKVWRAHPVAGDGSPGTIAATGPEGIDVQTAHARLRLEVVQPEGKRRMTAVEFARGRTVEIGGTVGR